MKFISYKNSIFNTVSALAISLAMLLLIIFYTVTTDHLKSIDVVLAILGLSIFGIGLIVNLNYVLTKKRQTAVIREDSYLFELHKSGKRVTFIILSGIQYSLALFLCLLIALVLGNNLSLLEHNWEAFASFYCLLTLMSGLLQYRKYRRIVKITPIKTPLELRPFVPPNEPVRVEVKFVFLIFFTSFYEILYAFCCTRIKLSIMAFKVSMDAPKNISQYMLVSR